MRAADRLPRVAVIGGGSSGIATVKVLHERGFDVVCFEKGERVGGNWVFQNNNGMSSSYRSLFINTSRDRMAYSDFPMPADYPDFPHHAQIAQYFDAYVDHFGFRSKIRFGVGVAHARLTPDPRHRYGGRWELQLESGAAEEFDFLCVANGHHWDPAWPDPPIPGEFDGALLHSHDYEEPASLDGKNVVILGMGNSAMDIAVDASYRARRTILAARRGAHIIPKYLFGKPIDQYATTLRALPLAMRARMFQGAIETIQGKPEDYGLLRPEHGLSEAHPTISGRILDRLSHGTITPKPNIVRFEGARVFFEDGSSEPADLVILCTGYKVSFPFFDPTLIKAENNDLPLFRRVFHPAQRGLAFIGLLQPLGAIMPLAEMQSVWVAEFLSGGVALPDQGAMERQMEEERDAMFKRYVASRRHTMQVDFDDYVAALQEERRLGRKRAAEQGGR